MSERSTTTELDSPARTFYSTDVSREQRRAAVGELPVDWTCEDLGAQCELITKGTTPTSLGKQFTAEGILFLKAEAISENGRLIPGKCAFIDKATHALLRRSQLAAGDLLISIAGVLGRVGRVEECDLPANTNQALAIVRLSKRSTVDRTFLFWCLQGAVVARQIRDISVQAAQANISLQNVREFLLPLPRPAEQHAIAEALSDADGLLVGLEALIAKKRAIKQGVMQQLLTGRIRLPGFNAKWEVKRLGDIALFFKGSGLSKADLTRDGKTRCIHYGELFTTYGESIGQVLSGTNREGLFFRSVSNDVLMPTSDVTPNGLATASCILSPHVILGADILVIRAPEDLLNGVFLAYAIKVHRSQVMQLVSGTTVFHLHGRDMANFQFPAPSIDEQTAIISALSDMEAEIAALERRREKTRGVKQGMMQQLLTGRVRLVKPAPPEADA